VEPVLRTNWPRQLIRLLVFFSFLLAACTTTPTPPVTPSLDLTANSATPTPPGLTAPPTITPSPTPIPIELVVCQTDAPASLYLYGDDTSARAGILDALFDGPIDSAGYSYQPVILASLPSLENGGAGIAEVEVRPGDTVVDAATGEVTLLGPGVQLAQPDGSRVVYTGTEPARTVQVSAMFTLLPNLTWSDGQPLTADDSLFSYEMGSSPDTPVSKFVVNRTARYEVVDDFSTRWTSLPGWLDTEFFLRFWTPLPRHLYGNLSAAALLADASVARHPVGWGPFVLGSEDWEGGDHLTMVRNPNYFRAAEGWPHVDRLTFRFGLTPEAILDEMRAGRCHIGAENVDFAGLTNELLAAGLAGDLLPQFASSTSFEHLDFGILPTEDYERSAGEELFQDVRVRQAVAYCLDRQTLVDQLLNGLAEIPDSYVPQAHPLYAAGQVTIYPFDPERGRALLEEAGWSDQNGDGVRESGRRKLVMDYASGPPGSAFREELMQLIQTQLRDPCGIEVQPALYSLEELYDPWPIGLLFGRRFDLGQFPWRTGIEPHCELYVSEAIPSGQNPGGANDTGYSNPDFDRACLAAKSALDAATRQARHAEAQAIFTRDLPSLPLFLRLKIGVVTPRVQGYALNPTTDSDLWNVEQISLAP
jgi:peptide/nickel transport system substrate-binding protein